MERQLDISDAKPDKVNIKDLVMFGDTGLFELLCKASSKEEGFMKSTKVCNVTGGCVMQVTTLQRNHDGTNAIAEALTYVPGVHIDRDIEPRKLVTNKY